MPHSVLIVDDEALIRFPFRIILSHLGYTVYEAVDGLECLEKVRLHRPDIVVLDVMMPRLDGLATMRALREDEATAKLPVIMASAKTDDETILAGLNAGANRYLPKPLGGKELEQNIREVLSEMAHE